MRLAFHLCLACLLIFGFSGKARATSIIFPKFGHPHVAGDRVVVVSPDGRRLLCFSRGGAKEWEKKLAAKSFLLPAPRGGLLVQIGREVFDLDVRTGAMRPRFRVAHDLRILSTPAPEFLHGLTYGNFPSQLMALDQKNGRVRWQWRNIDRVVGATSSVVVASRTEHMPAKGGGMLLTGSRLLAFDRESGALRWQRRAGPQAFPAVAFHGSRVAYMDEFTTTIRLIDVDTGRELAARKVALERGASTSGITMEADRLLLVVHAAGPIASKESIHRICTYSLPKLGRREETSVVTSEVAKAYRAGDGYLTDSLYRTIFFSAAGEQIWERFQCDRTDPADGRFYFSDYDGDARIGVVDLLTGRERIFAREKVEFEYPRIPESRPRVPVDPSGEPPRVIIN